jgi:hypothetical protein
MWGWVALGGIGVLAVLAPLLLLKRRRNVQHGAMTYRRFSETQEQIAEAWTARAEAADQWTLGAAVGRGEAGSFHITSDKGCRAVCKPAFAGEGGTPRAAHERNASDLARLLGLPVPPVCLWIDPATSHRYAISAWAFEQAFTWAEIATRLSAAFMQNAAATFSAARVFHTWIADTDHNNNPGNVVVDAASSDNRPGVAFIDHAFSMSYNGDFASAATSAVPVSYIPGALVDAGATREMIATINHLDERNIENVVGRIPTGFLPEDRRGAIISGLIKRKGELAGAFGVPPV